MYVFVLGTGRCGSTMVEDALARHPDVGFVSNIDDRLGPLDIAGRWNSAIYRRVPPRLTQKGRLRYAPSEAYRILDRQVSPLLSMSSRDLRADDVTPWLEDRVREFFRRRAEAQNATAFLHKFTGWPRAEFLHRIFPEAKFIHVVRDGRAVANSWLQMPWWRGYHGPEAWQFGPLPAAYAAEWEESGRSFVLLAGLAWKLLLDAFEVARAPLRPEQWLDIRYEDLLRDVRGTFGQIVSFAGLEWQASFESELGRHSFPTERSDAFRRDLDPANLALLDRSLAAHLRRWGYDAAEPGPPAARTGNP